MSLGGFYQFFKVNFVLFGLGRKGLAERETGSPMQYVKILFLGTHQQKMKLLSNLLRSVVILGPRST